MGTLIDKFFGSMALTLKLLFVIMAKHYCHLDNGYRCMTEYLCVAGALFKGHRAKNVKAALGASVVLMD